MQVLLATRHSASAMLMLGLLLAGCGSPASPVRTTIEPPLDVPWRLHALVHNGDLDGVKQAIADGADVNALVPDEWHMYDHDMGVPSFTPLQVAVWDSNTEIAQYLIAHGADVHVASQYVPRLLELALNRGNPELAGILLDAGADANAVLQNATWVRKYRGGETALTLAYKEGNNRLFQMLIEHGVDINYPNASGFGVLSIAALKGEASELDALIGLGADVNAPVRMPPLHAATYGGQTAAVRILLQHGANPNVFSPGGHVLLAAARGSHAEIVRVLLENGASLNARDASGHTVLTAADNSGMPDNSLAILLEYAEADTDLGDGDTPLLMTIRHGMRAKAIAFAREHQNHLEQKVTGKSILYYALDRGQLEIAGALVELDADVNLVVESGDPLLITLPRPADARLNVFRFLVEHGADVSVRDLQGFTVATRCFWQFEPYDLRFICTLIQHGIDLNVPNADGSTTLTRAARMGNPELVLILLDAGANPNLPGIQGRPPLFDAVYREDHEMIALLLERGANVDARDAYQVTPLSEAAELGNVSVCSLLLDHGADINTRQAYGQTPLHRAAGVGVKQDAEIVAFLLDHGANPASRSDGGETALMSAAPVACTESIRVLVRRGCDAAGVDHQGRTAIMHAARMGTFDTIPVLVELGCPVNATDNEGKAAIHWALQGYVEHINWCEREFRALDRRRHVRENLERKFTQTMESLLAAGADPDRPDSDGDSPAQLAEKAGLLDIAEVLRAASR
ncbi:MAG: ankyrin repeat domain-containing protein [Candidatus Hydrogenedentes bacterium]|nr:ankyrin repeat domain-containing protein [Candidatus Hydrogenedentota bacterium]